MIRAAAAVTAVLLLAACPGQPTTTPSAHPQGQSRALAVGKRPSAIAASSSLVYVANAGDATVSVIDTKAEQLVRTLAFDGLAPESLRAFPDRRHVLVIDSAKGELAVVDPIGEPRVRPSAGPSPELRPHQVMQRVALGAGIRRLALGDDQHAVVARADGKLTYLYFGLNRWNEPDRQELPQPAGELDVRGELAVVAGPDGRRPVAIELGRDKATPLEAAARADLVAIGNVDGVPARVLLIDAGEGACDVVDVGTGKATRVPELGKGAVGVAVDHSQKRAWIVLGEAREAVAVDYGEARVVARVALPGRPTAVTMAPPIPREVWVTTDARQLAVLDGAAGRVRAVAPIGAGPHAVTFWGTKGYVADGGDDTVTVVDRNTIR